MPPVEVLTEDKLTYSFFPAGRCGVVFRVKTTNDAHIALTTGPEESDPMLEVFIGGWKNTKSVIRKNRTKPDVVESDTPDFLSGDEFRGFWIRWTDNIVTVGKEGEAASFLTYEIAEPFPINFVGICTGWGATGSWQLDCPSDAGQPAWVQCSGSDIPAEAIIGGEDNGESVFIGRASHEGALMPGKVLTSHGVCYVAWGGAEHPKSEFEVLVGSGVTWVPYSNEIPPNAFPAGETEEGEPLFIGRVSHEGTLTVGKVQPSHNACYIPYGGEELAYTEFEVATV